MNYTRNDDELEAFEEGEGFAELGEAGFVGFELAGVHAAAKAAHTNWMLKVQHLVVEKVLDRIAWT